MKEERVDDEEEEEGYCEQYMAQVFCILYLFYFGRLCTHSTHISVLFIIVSVH